MSWLIDTNVISEVRRGAKCHATVAAWWTEAVDADLFLSVLSLGEIRKGCAVIRPRDARRAAAIERWLADIGTAFGQRVLCVDDRVAEAWGRMSAMRTVPVIDSLLAATALVHDLTLVTRNTSDVEGLGAKVLNPFTR